MTTKQDIEMDTIIEGVLFVLLYLVPLFFILSIGGYASDKIEDYLCTRAERKIS